MQRQNAQLPTLFIFLFGRIVHRTIRIRPNSLKPNIRYTPNANYCKFQVTNLKSKKQVGQLTYCLHNQHIDGDGCLRMVVCAVLMERRCHRHWLHSCHCLRRRQQDSTLGCSYQEQVLLSQHHSSPLRQQQQSFVKMNVNHMTINGKEEQLTLVESECCPELRKCFDKEKHYWLLKQRISLFQSNSSQWKLPFHRNTSIHSVLMHAISKYQQSNTYYTAISTTKLYVNSISIIYASTFIFYTDCLLDFKL